MGAPKTGDTPFTEEKPRLVDPDSGTSHNRPVQGDRPVENEVHLVEDTSTVPKPTVKDLRRLGYIVSDDLDEELPAGHASTIVADQPVEAGKVNLYVEEPAYPGGPAPEEPKLSQERAGTVDATPDPSPEEQGAESRKEKREAAEELHKQLEGGPSATAEAESQANANAPVEGEEPRRRGPGRPPKNPNA